MYTFQVIVDMYDVSLEAKRTIFSKHLKAANENDALEEANDSFNFMFNDTLYSSKYDVIAKNMSLKSVVKAKYCKNCHVEIIKGSYCSYDCESAARPSPVIYRVTNTLNDKTYIGKTRKPFTIRWLEHLNCNAGNLFHRELRSTPISDWSFQVLEVCKREQSDDEISLIEQKYITIYDSAVSGYNSRNERNEVLA